MPQSAMSGDGQSKRYVSTFRMYIKAPVLSQVGSTLELIGPHPGNTIAVQRGTRPATSPTEENTRPVEELRPPCFMQPLQDCFVDEGQDIMLQGGVMGSQPLSIKWLHNGKPACFGTSSFDGSVARLVVRECLPEDAGAYTCLVQNRAGKSSSSAAVCVRDYESLCGVHNKKLVSPLLPNPNCTMGNGIQRVPISTEDSALRVERTRAHSLEGSLKDRHRKDIIWKRRSHSGEGPAVQFKDPPKQVEVRAGETARLTCSFHSNFPVATCWIHNGEQVVNGPRFWVESSDKHSTLVISETQTSDVGKYIVVARDRRGFTQHAITLIIIERPQPPASSPVVSQLSGSSLVLSWSGPCYDGGSAVVGYVVEVRKEGPGEAGEWSEVTSRCRSTCYRVRSGLEPRGEYRFRVRAYNTVGISRPSQESDVIKVDAGGKPAEELWSCSEVFVDTVSKVTDHYEVMEKLGVGKFGQVFRLVHKETGRVCAGKFYKGRRSKERDAAHREMELMKSLQHPKLVQCHGAYDNQREVVMVMEYVAGGELFERIVDDTFEHTEPASVHYMRQILEGIRYMHAQSIVHLDLKPENIMCVNRAGTLIKIIDFGLASRLDPDKPLKVMHGTPEFVAPEVINFEPVGLTTDMWSVGVICYILLSGESPFQGNSDTETLAKVTAAQVEFDDENFEEVTDQAKDFISSLIKKDTRRRLSCDEALAHPWMASCASVNHHLIKTLSKEKMKKFLAKQKWKKTGKAVLALKRLAVLSSKADGGISPPSPDDDPGLCPEVERALKSLEEQLLSKPWFSRALTDQAQPQDCTAQFTCHVQGYPDPEVAWLQDGEPVEESAPRVQIEYEEDGRCTLVLTGLGPRDSGLYTCKATNSQGEALCTARLSVDS